VIEAVGVGAYLREMNRAARDGSAPHLASYQYTFLQEAQDIRDILRVSERAAAASAGTGPAVPMSHAAAASEPAAPAASPAPAAVSIAPVEPPPKPGTLREFKEVSERAFLVEKLREYGWNISRTAEMLDTPRSNLYKKLEQHQISQEKDG